MKTYSELIQLPTFEERFSYLSLKGNVGVETFGYDRIFNQQFYMSKEWKDIRKYVIARDNGCDLGHPDYVIPNGVLIFIHHIEPLLLKDIQEASDILLNPEYLITTAFSTHNAIHYGRALPSQNTVTIRAPFDTCPWKKGG